MRKIKFSRNFTRQRKKSPQKIRVALDKRLVIFLENPNDSLLRNHKLAGKYRGYRSIDITGDW